jgi:hypothetical protein
MLQLLTLQRPCTHSDVLDPFRHLGSIPISWIYFDASDSFQRFGQLTLQSPCHWFNISGVLSSLDASPSFWTSFLLFHHPLDLLLSSYSFLFRSNYVPFVSQRPPNVYYSLLLSCWTSIPVTTSQSQYQFEYWLRLLSQSFALTSDFQFRTLWMSVCKGLAHKLRPSPPCSCFPASNFHPPWPSVPSEFPSNFHPPWPSVPSEFPSEFPSKSLFLPTIPTFSPSGITSSTPEFDPLDPVLTIRTSS